MRLYLAMTIQCTFNLHMFNIQQFNLLFGLFKLTLIPQIAEFSRCSGWVGLKKPILQKKKI